MNCMRGGLVGVVLCSVLSAAESSQPVDDAAAEVQEDAVRQAKAAQMWKVMSDGVAAKIFSFRVVDQNEKPAAGIPVLFWARYRNADFLITGDPFTIDRQELVTDVAGIARTTLVRGQNFEATISPSRMDNDRWAIPPFEMALNEFKIKAGQSPEHAGISPERRPTGFDYEFRIIRYPQQGQTVFWQSVKEMKTDGSWETWNPLAQSRLRLVGGDTTIQLPDSSPEWEVSLWREPGALIETRTKYMHPLGFEDVVEKVNPVHWRMAIRAKRGDFHLSTWKPLTQDGRDLFPIVDVMPTDGFQKEVVWDVPEQEGRQPLSWNKPVALYWRRPGQPTMTLQIRLTPYWIDRRKNRMSVEALPEFYRFGIKASLTALADGAPILALSPDAVPRVRGTDWSGISPSWYQWADRPFLERLLAMPEPGK